MCHTLSRLLIRDIAISTILILVSPTGANTSMHIINCQSALMSDRGVDQKEKGNICFQIEFLCFFFSLCTFYFFGGLGLGVAFIWIIANTL